MRSITETHDSCVYAAAADRSETLASGRHSFIRWRSHLSKVWRPTIARICSLGTLTSGHRHQRLLQLSPVPATPNVEQLSIGVGRRTLAISLAVLIPALLLFMLLSFGFDTQPDYREAPVSVVSLEVTEISEEAPEPSSAERERTEEQPVPPQPETEEPRSSEPAEPLPPQAAAPMAAPAIPPPSERPASPAPPRIGIRPPGRAVSGPPNLGLPPSPRATERV